MDLGPTHFARNRKLRRVRRETCVIVNAANNDNVRMPYFLNFIH